MKLLFASTETVVNSLPTKVNDVSKSASAVNFF